MLISVVLFAAFLYTLYHYVLHPLFISPLRHIPSAHAIAPFSSLWILYVRFYSRENSTIAAAHTKHGHIVRLSPDEISINTTIGVKIVYGSNFEKHRWYEQMENFGNVPVMFSMLGNAEHSARKRIISHVYSKSALQGSETIEAVSKVLVGDRMMNKLREAVDGMTAEATATVDIMKLMNATTMDFVTSYLFGLKNASGFLEDDKELAWWLDVFHRRRPWGFLDAELPQLRDWLIWIGIKLAPNHVAEANKEIGDWVMSMCDKADSDLATAAEKGINIPAADIPVVWQQLRSSAVREKQTMKDTRFDDKLLAASEMWDHLSAGHETSAITLSYIFHELTLHPHIQSALRTELLTLSPSLSSLSKSGSSDDHGLPSPRSIDALPLLDAILMETLRLHSAIPGPQPRLTPAHGCTLDSVSSTGTVFIPGGNRVSAMPYTLHRDSSVFPEPETWRPWRWLDDPSILSPIPIRSLKSNERDAQLKEMHRQFWAFSSGARMCTGMHLAKQETKLIVAAVVSCFELEVVDREKSVRDMRQEDAYTAGPVGKELFVGIKRVVSRTGGAK
jgi:cytochrome P450